MAKKEEAAAPVKELQCSKCGAVLPLTAYYCKNCGPDYLVYVTK
jgi:ribosomal protein L40E